MVGGEEAHARIAELLTSHDELANKVDDYRNSLKDLEEELEVLHNKFGAMSVVAAEQSEELTLLRSENTELAERCVTTGLYFNYKTCIFH